MSNKCFNFLFELTQHVPALFRSGIIPGEKPGAEPGWGSIVGLGRRLMREASRKGEIRPKCLKLETRAQKFTLAALLSNMEFL
jgi:hypothetical protein